MEYLQFYGYLCLAWFLFVQFLIWVDGGPLDQALWLASLFPTMPFICIGIFVVHHVQLAWKYVRSTFRKQDVPVPLLSVSDLPPDA